MSNETKTKQSKKKKVFVLRIRDSDSEPWGEPGYYRTKGARHRAEAINRIIGGIRTHSYEELKTPEEIEEMYFNDY